MERSPHQPQRRRPVRRIGVAVLLVALLAAACADDPTIDASAVDAIETNDGNVLVKPPDVLEGEPEPALAEPAALPTSSAEAVAAPVVDLTYFDGTLGSTADFVGTPTVLNFWASNCPACVAEMPDFEEVHQARLGEVAFVGVNVADVSREAAVDLAARTGVTYPLVDDTSSAIFREFRGFVMPTTVLLNAQGEVAYTWSGVLTSGELQRLIDEHIAPGGN